MGMERDKVVVRWREWEGGSDKDIVMESGRGEGKVGQIGIG